MHLKSSLSMKRKKLLSFSTTFCLSEHYIYLWNLLLLFFYSTFTLLALCVLLCTLSLWQYTHIPLCTVFLLLYAPGFPPRINTVNQKVREGYRTLDVLSKLNTTPHVSMAKDAVERQMQIALPDRSEAKHAKHSHALPGSVNYLRLMRRGKFH